MKLEFSRDNSGYLGRFVTANHTGVEGWKDLVGTHKYAFGPWNVERSEPVITLSDDCRLYLHPETPVSGSSAKIATGTDPIIGTSVASGDKFLTFSGGATISGAGTLTLDAGKAGILLDDVTLGGFTGISFIKGKAAISENSTVALPVTLKDGASLAPNGSNVGMMKMGTLALTDTVVNYHCTVVTNVDDTLSHDQVVVDGNLTIPTDGCRIKVLLSDIVLFTEIADTKLKLFSAANLGEAGGLNADDFSVAVDSEYAQDFGGTFAVEAIDGAKWVTFTKTTGPVYVRHIAKGDGYGENSFLQGTRWEDGEPPSSGKDYFSDVLVRSPENANLNAVFQGRSLALATGAQLNLKVVDKNLTISNLVMGSGAKIVTAGADGIHHLRGTALAVATRSNPTRFSTVAGRHMEISSVLRGAGAIRFDFVGGGERQSNDKPATFHLTGESPAFTGSIFCTGNHTHVFDGELCMGGPSADGTTVRPDNFVLQSNAVLRIERSFNLTDATRGMKMDGTGGRGGVFEILEGVAMTNNCPIAGDGFLRKTGAGTLVLNGANTLSNEIDLQAGTLGAGHATAFGTAALTYSGSPTLRIESTAGVAVKSIASMDGSELNVVLAAFENRNKNGRMTSDIFRLPKGTAFDLDAIAVSKDNLKGWKVELQRAKRKMRLSSP